MRIRTMVAATMTGLAASAAIPVAYGEPNVKPGMWETTVYTNMPGMPMAPPPLTQRSCITREDLVPPGEQPGQECTLSDHDVSGNTVTWHVECEHRGMTTKGEGRLTYAGDTYEGTVTMNMQGGPMGAMDMTQTLKGRRVGDCVN